MSKQRFSVLLESVELAAYLAENSVNQLWYDGAETVVYIGSDMPVTPTVSLDRLQFRLQATAMGLRAAIEAYVAGAHQNVKDWYAETETFEIDNPMLLDGVRALNAEALLPEFFRLGALQPSVRR